MKVYGTLKTKDPIAYVLFADADYILYHDSECEDAVTASEAELMFFKGAFVSIDGVFISVSGYEPAGDSAAYATLYISDSDDEYFTAEYEPEEDGGAEG